MAGSRKHERASCDTSIVLPIIVPLVAGAAMFFLAEARRTARVTLAVASVLTQLAVAVGLLYLTSDAAPYIWPEGVGVYAIGGWPAPFGIVLVVDRLSAVMLTLGAIVALATLVYSVARWDRPGQPFHSLFQFLTMGLNGAFLTGDLFNLFVFFEILLAASYGLLLRGGGAPRVKLSLHYIAVNLIASFLFLIGVALIYGVAGTLNMADLGGPRRGACARMIARCSMRGRRFSASPFSSRPQAGRSIFGCPGAYSIALAPVAAAFAMMTKVGFYAVLRLGTLMQEYETLGAALFYIGLATLISGTIGMLAAKHLARSVAYSVLVSMGILLASPGPSHRSAHGPGALLSDRVGLDDLHILHADRDDRSHTCDRSAGLARRPRRRRSRARLYRLRHQDNRRYMRAARMSASPFPPPWPSSA